MDKNRRDAIAESIEAINFDALDIDFDALEFECNECHDAGYTITGGYCDCSSGAAICYSDHLESFDCEECRDSGRNAKGRYCDCKYGDELTAEEVKYYED